MTAAADEHHSSALPVQSGPGYIVEDWTSFSTPPPGAAWAAEHREAAVQTWAAPSLLHELAQRPELYCF